MTLRRFTVRRLRLPLESPYRLSYRTFTEFEPFLVEVEDDALGVAFADAHISPGSSAETREGGWRHLADRLPGLLGMAPSDAKARLTADFEKSKVATTAAVVALELLEARPATRVETCARLPLLKPVAALTPNEIEAEIERSIADGFTTLKVKVGKDVDADIARMTAIQRAARGRVAFRVDANRAYAREEAIAFVRGVDPENIVLFEQPCEADLWDDNAAVAAASDIPVMLDEPICTLEDIARAADIPGVGYCKVKLKRFGGLAALEEGINAIEGAGMGAVLGDGLGSDLHGWLEALIAARTIHVRAPARAGEFNGFLKMTGRLLAEPLAFKGGAMDLAPGPAPALDRHRVEAATVKKIAFT